MSVQLSEGEKSLLSPNYLISLAFKNNTSWHLTDVMEHMGKIKKIDFLYHLLPS
jgi:hypothetical protein